MPEKTITQVCGFKIGEIVARNSRESECFQIVGFQVNTLELGNLYYRDYYPPATNKSETAIFKKYDQNIHLVLGDDATPSLLVKRVADKHGKLVKGKVINKMDGRSAIYADKYFDNKVKSLQETQEKMRAIHKTSP